MKDASIGERIRELRGSTLSQRRLAERAEVSVDLIRKLEQGSRTGASIASLHKIARALDVDIADLLGKRHGLPSPDPDAGVVAIRRALTTVDDLLDTVGLQEPVSLLEATRAVEYAWGAYWSGRYGVLASILPSGIAQLRAAAHAAQNQDIAPVNEQLARMMWVTGCTLVHFGQTDPAFIAIREALQAAERGNDPLLAATLRGSVGWQLLVQGRFEEARGVALKAAATVEPAGEVSPAHLSVYGALLLQGATAAGRNQHTREAISLAQEARETAARLGRDRKDYETDFGPSQVVMQTVDINISAEKYSEAIQVAKTMPNHGAGLKPVAQARHLVDQAQALARTGQHQKALDMLLTAERVGGAEWAKYQTLLRTVIAELLDHDRRTSLRDLAQRVGVNS